MILLFLKVFKIKLSKNYKLLLQNYFLGLLMILLLAKEDNIFASQGSSLSTQFQEWQKEKQLSSQIVSGDWILKQHPMPVQALLPKQGAHQN